MIHHTPIGIDPLSRVSLFLQPMGNGLKLGSATGFLVPKDNRYYLITNWHVFAGRHPVSNQPLHKSAAVPDECIVIYNRNIVKDGQHFIGWCQVTEPLHDSAGKRRWLEHPDGNKVDVAALPVAPSADQATVHPLPLSLAMTDLFAGVGESVSIVGYPFGLTAGGAFPIWKTGHIASEPDVDYQNSPVILIDATTKDGMSGSPVYRRFPGVGWRTRRGTNLIASKTVYAGGSDLTRFMGVYAGRIGRVTERQGESLEESAEIGRVWKPEVVEQILNSIPTSPGR
jgi:hypothetical protein